MNAPKVEWYASGGGIAKCGPYASQLDAYRAMRLTDEAQREQAKKHGTDSPYPYDVVVWPEAKP